ncbi:hypothetical protein JX266_005731 [Neoarthrinium moseri]|nr:hypothetical protein JX266_005731 [Neoarthrinium moseri]
MSSVAVADSVIIIGAGIFGLSTALAISRRWPSAKVTIIDRLTPPVEDGTSVDTTRCIRADYADSVYARLAAEAQRRIEDDVDLSRHYFKQGMSFICDGKPGRFFDIWAKGLENARKSQDPSSLVEMHSANEVFSRLHGPDAKLVSEQELGRSRNWIQGYCNLEDAFIDAPVDRVVHGDGVASGVLLDNGEKLNADLIIIAAGAWSARLLDLQDSMFSSAIEVAWVKVTAEEERRWKNMSITTNLSTGFNIFPPHNGDIKMLRRSAGYRNTVTVPHPEDSNKMITISYPRTTITKPTDVIPQEAEDALRDNLKELFPTLASRPFDRTKLCWLAQTPTADFIVCPHPRIQGLHVATGGSAHAWKFLPIIGDLVLDSIEGILDEELKQKWRWGRNGGDSGNAPRMEGSVKELKEIVGDT